MNYQYEGMDEYQKRAHSTAIYPKNIGLEYATLGVAGEAGELANKVKKWLRGDYADGAIQYEEFVEKVKGELGDILWYIAETATVLHIPLSDIASMNIAKVMDRAARGKTKGEGDNR